MKTVEFTNPIGGAETKIVRVSDQKAEELVDDEINKGLRKYVPKSRWKTEVRDAGKV